MNLIATLGSLREVFEIVKQWCMAKGWTLTIALAIGTLGFLMKFLKLLNSSVW